MLQSDTLAPAPAENPDFDADPVAAFEQLLTNTREALVAHEAAVTAYSAMETRKFAGEIGADDPDMIAAEEAERAAVEAVDVAEKAVRAAKAPTTEQALEKARLLGLTRADDLLVDVAAEISDALRRPSAGATAFSRARDAYEAARDAHDAVNAEYLAINAAADAEAPFPESLQTTGSRRHDLRSAVAIDNASWLTFERKADLLGVLREWEARRREAEERHGVQAAEDRRNQTDIAMGEACERLMCAEPGSIQDLAYMARIAMDAFTQGPDEHPDDPRTIQRILYEGDYEEVMAARLYIATLRLAGENSPVLSVEPFDPEAWLNEFEVATGRRISDERGPEFLDHDAPDGDAYQEGAARWRDLRKWQKVVVIDFAKERHEAMSYAAGPYSRAHDLIAIAEEHGGKFAARDGELVLDRAGDARESHLRLIEDALDTFPEKRTAIMASLENTPQQAAA